ncbi:MAG: hypothetical protein LBS99_05985 [Clostridiales bacterium]|jgi:hypothetical protein|nr:hypothetical protein [Clostridiales bacterium]
MKKLGVILIAAVTAAIMLIFTACGATDVIANYAVGSFEKLSDKIGNAEYGDGKHTLTSPGGKEKFIWGGQIVMEIDLSELISAELDVAKLIAGGFNIDGNTLAVELQNAAAVTDPDGLAAFEKNMRGNRKALGFDVGMGHFGIAFGNEFAFEWAQYLDANDKDMVFLLNPAPFIEAGLKTDILEGWLYAELEMMKEKAFMLVKAYDL